MSSLDSQLTAPPSISRFIGHGRWAMPSTSWLPALLLLLSCGTLLPATVFGQSDSGEPVIASQPQVEEPADQPEAETEAVGLDQRIDQWFGWATGWFVGAIFAGVPIMEGVTVPWVLFPLVFGAVFFTLCFGFPNVRYFGTAINIVRGKYDDLENDGKVSVSSEVASTVDGDNPDTIRVEGHEGEVSHFQALTAALSGTVGLGNIAGVAIALSLGGPGATFWMIVCGLLGMSTKFAECTLGVSYREIDSKGVVFGGPMYYLS